MPSPGGCGYTLFLIFAGIKKRKKKSKIIFFSKAAERKRKKQFRQMRLCHPPDVSTSPKYKLLCFVTTKKICKEKNALAPKFISETS
jgi:hypothetical protein